jgi:predicted short-subunit dehydrogenase-like oxidoreductase (DUF2520 family)
VNERIVIVGPGRMGLALGAALWRSRELESLLFLGRSIEAPPHPIFDATADGAAAEYRTGIQPLPAGTTVLILAVPDGALGAVAYELAQQGPAPGGCVALHLSGALGTDALTPLHYAGYAVGSMHPLQSVADPWTAADRLYGSAYALAGEPAAVGAAHRLVDALAGRPIVIPGHLRPLYHAAAVFASNYLVAQVAGAVRILQQAGVEGEEALPAILPLVRGTLDNIEKLGVIHALTGPIVRGDVDTVRLHLAQLSAADRPLYCALGRETLSLACEAGLSEERAAELAQLLATA